MLGGRFPQRIKRLSGKARNYNSNSSPYLSGDSFADLCDFNFQPPRLRGLLQGTQIEHAKTLFCPSHLLEDFLSIYGDRIAGQVLIIGNSDRDFESFELTLPPSIKNVYIQNLNFKSDSLKILPIGIENLRLDFNGRLENFDSKHVIRQKENRILIGPFALSHPERNFIHELKKYDRTKLEVNQDRLSPRQYAELSSRFKFVACPRGNGIDTHRFWETLYRGSIPVIKSSEWSKNLKGLGLPYIEIEGWDEENLCRIPEIFRAELFDPRAIETLWMPFWENSIQSLIRD